MTLEKTAILAAVLAAGGARMAGAHYDEETLVQIVGTDRISCAQAGEYWGYDPDEARAFGKHVQTILAENDTEAFLDILHGELERGPGRAEIRQAGIRNALGPGWLKSVLDNPAPCKPVGWRGFMIASGKLWYRKIGGAWRVFAVNR